jgi:hypothetical protein
MPCPAPVTITAFFVVDGEKDDEKLDPLLEEVESGKFFESVLDVIL